MGILLIFDAMANIKRDLSWKDEVDQFTKYSIVSRDAVKYVQGIMCISRFFIPQYEDWMINDGKE